jgi:hypothetical protein
MMLVSLIRGGRGGLVWEVVFWLLIVELARVIGG